ncbi:flagellar basal body-associated FliL family protein [Falsiroseomonas selenitidurans]|uniref:Flagellar protein FliL n=1 Tax=Falsiroseomonas selenitidurans TaxID=2716335 RepID=A0ABX1E9U0_9PROT|nr:flagellar basal body-associated FliL family protein [Falsiroseomonas selenitidurans]NKC31690.1 flagellar basal body protein FliL [Falsiroseomonas selenitidurans]
MSTAVAATEAPPARRGKGRLFVILGVVLLLLAGGGAGAAFFLKLGPFAEAAAEAGEAAAEHAPPPAPPVFVEIPDIVANLNVGNRRATFVRLRSRLEVARAEDVAVAQAAMPRLLDLFTTYLRETRPEELRGSAGTHRLREELLARANLATRAGAVTDVLFVEMIVQ